MPYIGVQPTQTAFVTDLFNGTGSATAFTMSVSPANPASILVAVSGVLQSPDTYSISGQTLNFSAAPPSGTGNISVRYLGIPATGVTTTAYRTVTEFTATAGQTTFSVPSYTVGYIDVYRNGVRLGAADYTASNGTSVVLVNGASSGDLITTESFYVSSVLNAIPAVAGAVTNSYLLDGSVSQAKLATGVAGNGPAFRAYNGSDDTGKSSGAFTKIRLNTENFDTASCFDSTTNYRFTPNIAGYYQFNVGCYVTASNISATQLDIYKNGASVSSGQYFVATSGATAQIVNTSDLIYLNGSTDYVEFYMYVAATAGTFTVKAGTTYTYAGGFLARAA